MNELLKPQQKVKSVLSGVQYEIVREIGSGGQGEVYIVKAGNTEYALKWYFHASATHEQRDTIENLVKAGKPSENFLWPEDLVVSDNAPGLFGYIMGLRPPGYRSLNDYASGKVRPTAQALITMGIELTKAFRSLHTKGLCYRDISFGNAFFRPDTGEVLVCDNDNVAPNRTPVSGVLGTVDFMAPEVVRMEALPSRETDYHSLAVLLFYTFCMGHPLVGRRALSIRCWDAPAREKMFGKEPLFIFDPKYKENEAVEGDSEAGGTALIYWNIYPAKFKDTFTKAFTVGLKPDSRITELEWLQSLSSLMDSSFRCSCGTPNYYDIDVVKSSGGKTKPCWHCKQEPKLPFRIHIGNLIVMLNADTKLYSHHVGGSISDIDFKNPVAEVSRHPKDPNIWGIKNLTTYKWTFTTASNETRDVEPGRSVPLSTGTKINFGKVEGEIIYQLIPSTCQIDCIVSAIM